MTWIVRAVTPTLIFAICYSIGRVCKLDRMRLPWRTAAWLIVAVLVTLATIYTFLPVLMEDTESNIASVAAVFVRGGALYPALGAPDRYLLLYGPLTYLGRVLLFPLLGTGLVAFKLAGLAALFTALYAAYRIARAYVPPSIASICLGAYALILFRFLAASMWGRCDPFLVCAAALGVWAALRGRWMIVAFAMACLVDLKITGAAYALPILALLYVNTRAAKAAASLGLSIAFAFAPFLLPQVSLSNYLFALRRAAQHGLEAEFLLRNLQYSWLLLLPVLALLLGGYRLQRKQTICLAAIVCGLLLSSLAGAKIGAGSYHLLPHIAIILQLFCWIYSSEERLVLPLRRVAAAWVVTWLFFSGNELKEVTQAFRSLHQARTIESEITSVLDAHPGTAIEVGAGDRYEDPRTRYSFVTSFHGEPYTLSYPALRDLQLGGVPLPASTLSAIASCRTPIWLIPKDQPPFAAPNTYFETYRPAFDGIGPLFLAHYRKSQSLHEYDVWECSSR